jgi:uncharacterized protein (TIGR02246 family)
MTDNQPATDTNIERVDDEQLRALFRRICQAWTDGDAEAYGACFTPDCDYVSFDGTRTQGRDGVVESHDKLFRGVLFGTALVGEIESIRYLADDVAVLHGNGSVLVAWRTRLPKRRLTRNTLVAVRGHEGCRHGSPAHWSQPPPPPAWVGHERLSAQPKGSKSDGPWSAAAGVTVRYVR